MYVYMYVCQSVVINKDLLYIVAGRSFSRLLSVSQSVCEPLEPRRKRTPRSFPVPAIFLSLTRCHDQRNNSSAGWPKNTPRPVVDGGGVIVLAPFSPTGRLYIRPGSSQDAALLFFFLFCFLCNALNRYAPGLERSREYSGSRIRSTCTTRLSTSPLLL